MVKGCTKCGEEKALTEFHKDKSKKFGVASTCKVCKAEWLRNHPRKKEIDENKRKRACERYRNPKIRQQIRERKRKYDQTPEAKAKQRERNKTPHYKEKARERYRLSREMGTFVDKSYELSKKYTTRNNAPWSDAEIKFLMSSDLRLVDIALELGRSYGSVQKKRNSMRNDNILTIAINNATRGRTQWSKTDDERLLAHKGALVDIALELGRSYHSVVQRRVKLLQSK